MASPLFLLELVAYDIGGAAAVTLRYSSPVGFITGPAETPANTLYEPRLLTPMPVKRDLFDAGSTSGRSRIDYGDVELLNGDGALDALLTYGYGRAVTLRKGTLGAAYPAGFTTIFDGTALGVEGSGDRLRVKLRSGQLNLEQPLQSTKYDGDNVLPDGLEGVADDLKGKPKPVCLGAVLNIAPPCVNTSKLIYQVNDGAVQSIDAVYDSGLPLGDDRSTFTFTTDASFGANTIRSIAYGLNQSLEGRVAVVGDGGKMSATQNGTSWTNYSPNDLGGSNIYAVAFGTVTSAGEANVIVAGDSGKLYTYGDAVFTNGNGTSRTSQFGATAIRGLLYLPGVHVWVAVGDSGKISTSADGGQTWTSRTSGVGTALYGAAYGLGRLIAFGASGVVLYSDDYGTNWTTSSSGFSTTDIYAGAFGRDSFAIAGGANKIASSLDGISWTLTTFTGTGATLVFRGATYVQGRFILAGEEQLIVTGDRTDWVQSFRTAGSTDDFFGVADWPGIHTYTAGTDGTDGSIYISLAPIAYANTTDLQDDTLAPGAGSYGYYLTGGYIRLGSPPAGEITADVTQGASAGARTAGQLFAVVLARAGKSAGTAAGNWLAADVTALDSANAAVLGDWISEEEDFASVIDRLANSVGAWWGLDRLGRYRIVRFTAPSGSPVATITANDMKKDSLVRVTLAKDGISNVPTWRTKVRYGKNYTVQTSGLAGAVSDDRRAFLAQEYREVVNESASVQTAHVLAVESVYDTLMASASAAATEASRLQTLRGTLRHCFDVTVPLNDDYATVDLNDLVTLTHPRYSLSAGVLHRVIGVSPDSKAEWVTLRLWR